MVTHNGITVKTGDKITIQAERILVTGIVARVSHWSGIGWDIEMDKANVPGGYSRWKERDDGGKIVSINGKPV